MNAIERAQNAFEAEYKSCEKRQRELSGQVARRKFFAYGAKLLVAISGLLMTLDAVKPYNVPVGFMISIVVTLDFIFSNHVKLLVLTKAKQAYARLLKQVSDDHTVKMPELLAIKDTDEARFSAQLLPFLQELLRKLQNQRRDVEHAIDQADLKALNRLAIDTA